MSALPFEPLQSDTVINVPAPAVSNPDLPADAFPSLSRIVTTDLVGPSAANKQHKGLEKRTLALQQAVARIAAVLAAIDNVYVRKDGTTQKDTNTGFTSGVDFGNHKGVRVSDGTIGSDAVNKGQLDLKAPLASPALTGAPTAPTPATSDRSTKIATTAFVGAVVDGLSPVPLIGETPDVSISTGQVDKHSNSDTTMMLQSIPLKDANGKLLIGMRVDSVNSGNLDFDNGAFYRLRFDIVDASDVVVTAASLGLLALLDVIRVTGGYVGRTSGFIEGTRIPVNNTTPYFGIQEGSMTSVGAYVGSVHVMIAGLSRILAAGLPGAYKLRVRAACISGSSSTTQTPGHTIQGFY